MYTPCITLQRNRGGRGGEMQTSKQREEFYETTAKRKSSDSEESRTSPPVPDASVRPPRRPCLPRFLLSRVRPTACLATPTPIQPRSASTACQTEEVHDEVVFFVLFFFHDIASTATDLQLHSQKKHECPTSSFFFFF